MIFSYEAYNSNGEKVFGTIEAETRDEVTSQLYSQELIVSQIKAVKNVSRSAVKPEELIVFTRLLATGINASIPLTKALEITMEELPPQSALRMVILSILHQLKIGKNLSDALAMYLNIFSEMYVNMVRAGERSGRLGQALSEVLKYLMKRFDMNKKVSSALLYPGVIMSFAALILIFFIVVLIPRFQESYQSFGGEIPGFTMGLISVTNWIKNNLIWIGLAITLLVLGIKQAIRQPQGRKIYETVLFAIPVVGELIKKDILSRFARTLSVLLANGITLVEGLDLLRGIVNNSLFEETIRNATHDLTQGKNFTGALKANPHIPGIMLQMAAMGEESGRLSELMGSIADFYEKEVDNSIEKITSVITPIMILFIGVIIGIIVVGLFLPIFDISQIIEQRS